jgi:hypothetical protein
VVRRRWLIQRMTQAEIELAAGHPELALSMAQEVSGRIARDVNRVPLAL